MEVLNKIKAFFAMLLAFILAFFGIKGGTKPTTDTTTTTEPSTSETAQVDLTSLTYGADKNQIYSLYLPSSGATSVPLVVFMPGGAWYYCSEQYEKPNAEQLSKTYGVAAMTMTTRMNSDTTIPMMLDDMTTCVKDAITQASKRGVSFNAVAFVGNSSGSHLSAMYSYSRQSECPLPIRFCMLRVCPTDFTDPQLYHVFVNNPQLDRTLFASALSGVTGMTVAADISDDQVTAMMADPTVKAALLKVSPVNYVSTAVPTILAYGDKDDIVAPTQSPRLKAALDNAGIVNTAIEFPNSGHSLDSDADKTVVMYDTLAQYIHTFFGI